MYALIVVAVVALVIVWVQGEGNIDWIKFLFLAGIMVFIFCLSSFLGVRSFLKNIKNHTLEITEEGIKSNQDASYTLISWKNIDSITEKTKNNKVVKLILKTKEHGEMNFREYGDLNKLSLDLKKYIDKSKWK